MSTTPTSVALTTGGASGIGFAIARKLLSQGSTVALVDLGAERLQAAARQLGGDVLTFEADSDGFRARAAQCSPQMGESGALATPSVALHNKTHQDSVT